MELNTFFEHLWEDYIAMAPQAKKIHALFTQDNAEIVNDHVAFRTFNRFPIALENLEKHFFSLGYERLESYIFKEKKLYAWGYIPINPKMPRIFLSELLVEELSPKAQTIIDNLCKQIELARVINLDIFWTGRLWEMPTWKEYQTLLAESEYAAWVSAIGIRANHFTISVNYLNTPKTLEGVIERVEKAGFAINSAGGKIKGSQIELLEQASTLADRGILTFREGHEHEIPTCYYEFAKRYPDSNQNLYQGFVAASADKIFESTNTKGIQDVSALNPRRR